MVAADEESGLRRQELRFVKGMFVRMTALYEQRRPCTAANAQLRLDCIGRESLTIFREPARQPHTGDKALDESDRDKNDAHVMASLPARLHPFIVATVLFAEAPAVNAHGLQEHGHASLFGSQRVKTKCPTAVWRTLLPERSFPRERTQRHVAYTVSSLTLCHPFLHGVMDAVSVALRLVEDVAERAVVSSRLFLKPSKFLGVKAGCPVDKGNSIPELLQVLGKVSYPRESSMRFLCLLSRWTHASASYTSPVGLLLCTRPSPPKMLTATFVMCLGTILVPKRA